MAKKMRFDYNNLQLFDFIHLDSKFWGKVDCVVIGNNGGKIEFLPTNEYEKSEDPHYSYFTIEDPYEELNGYYHKSMDDLILLLGKTDRRIIKMIYKVFDDE